MTKTAGTQPPQVSEKLPGAMRAAVMQEPKQPLSVQRVEIPQLEPDEVLIKIEASGVCHSDLSIVEGEWQTLKRIVKKDLIPGHEIVGHVVERGRGVRHLEIGDRVGVAWVHWTCGACDMCKEGFENLCPNQKITGVTVNGGFAEFMKAKASHALKVPKVLSSIEAAPLFCAGVTSYRAVKNARIQPGQRVAVFGIGGLGHLVVQIAKAFGAQVTAVDINDEKLQLARKLGADHSINARTEEVVKEFRKQDGVHAAIVTSAAKAAYDQAFFTVRPAGTLVIVGLPSEDLNFSALQMREIKITSVATGTREDMQAVLNLAAEAKIRCLVEVSPLERINEIFDQMRKGQIAARVVLKM